jgi:TatD DNase family protein
MIITGASESGSQEALELALTYPGELYATCGVHPHHAADFTADTDAFLRALASQAGVVAIGETGLDYFRDFSPRAAQLNAFERQLQIGIDCGLPLFLHQRDAHDDLVAMLRGVRDQLSDVVVHCFTGTKQELFQCLDLDCHIGITGWICDERRGTHMQDFMRDIPAERLMIETDSPYLKPRNLKPRVKTHRNEPQWLPWIAQTLARCRGETVEQLAAQTTASARSFFRLQR